MNKFEIFNEDCLQTLGRMADNSIDMVLTSPPYPGADRLWGELFKAENFEKAHEFLHRVWNECLRVLKPGCKLVINIANTKRRPYLPNVYKVYDWALEQNRCEPVGEIIWHKGYGQNGTAWGSYRNPSDPALSDQHEYIIVLRKYGERRRQKGYFIEKDDFLSWRNAIWKIAPEKASKIGHTAPFPVELARRLIIFYTYPGETVYDPFSGSGTTGVAALREGRNYVGSEIVKNFYELSLERCSAALDGTGN